MMTKATDFQGRKPAKSPTLAHYLGRFALLGLILGGSAQAENVLEDLTYTAQPGGRVEITMRFSEPVDVPQAFTTENPPRIALDLADTRSALNQRRIEVGAGATSGISTVEAAGRTRIVVDLFRPATYETRINGNELVLTVASSTSGSTAVAASAANRNPTKTIAAQTTELTGVDFRRGKTGEGRIVLSFSGPGAAADLKTEGDKVVLDIANVKLPPNLAQRLDVLDFATPVQFIESRSRGTGVRLEISAQGPFEQLAYQTGTEYVVEISPKREDEKLKKNAEPVFNGSRVTFNFQDIPTRSVLQLIADVSDLNIVVADSVQGNVTLRLINVPWDQALHIVLQAKGLDQRKQGNVIWVAPQKEISDREQAIADARLKMEDKVELVADYIPISYGNAKDIAQLLTKDVVSTQAAGASDGGQQQRGFLSQRGTVSYDDRTNTLLVSDTPQKILEIRALIAVLDRPVQQVLIESRIVIATDTFARELGVKFGISGGYQDNNGNIVSTSGSAQGTDRMSNIALNNRYNGGSGLPVFGPGTIPTSGSVGGGGGIAVPNLNDRLNVNLPVVNPAGSFGLAILGADYLLDLELSAAQTEGRGEVVSSPRVVTANQKEAVIKQGQEIAYVTYEGGTSGGSTATVNFKEVVLELKVTPTITADDRVVLNLGVKKDNVARYIENPGGGFVPVIDKREINTSVLVDNGQTVVLGGVYEVEKRDDVNKVPFLGDVPFLGNLFKKTVGSDSKAELLIFVTPRILSDNLK